MSTIPSQVTPQASSFPLDSVPSPSSSVNISDALISTPTNGTFPSPLASPVVEELAPIVTVEILLPDETKQSWTVCDTTRICSLKEIIWGKLGDSRIETWEQIRLLYLGRFLKDDSTLRSLGIVPENTAVFHLNVKSLAIPDSVETDGAKPVKSSSESSGCCVII